MCLDMKIFKIRFGCCGLLAHAIRDDRDEIEQIPCPRCTGIRPVAMKTLGWSFPQAERKRRWLAEQEARREREIAEARWERLSKRGALPQRAVTHVEDPTESFEDPERHEEALSGEFLSRLGYEGEELEEQERWV